MATEVSYIIITPYSLLKSRTGGIIARLMSRTDLEFVGAQMLAFTREMAEKYAQSLEDAASHISSETGKLLSDYVLANFPPREDGCLRIRRAACRRAKRFATPTPTWWRIRTIRAWSVISSRRC